MITVTDNLYLFWHTDSHLSNWCMDSYELDGIKFSNSEQGMMYEKAKLFDKSAIDSIMDASHPREVKALGRSIQNFIPDEWDDLRVGLLIPHLMAKFKQNNKAYAELMSSGDRIIAEASPFDKVWGIGLSPEDPLSLDPINWRGLNLLGESLMLVRYSLSAEAANEG